MKWLHCSNKKSFKLIRNCKSAKYVEQKFDMKQINNLNNVTKIQISSVDIHKKKIYIIYIYITQCCSKQLV